MATPAETLTKLDTLLDNIANDEGIQSHTINGRSVTHYPLKELQELREKMAAEAAYGKTGGTTNYFRRGTV